MPQDLSPLEAVKQSINPYERGDLFARLAQGTVADINPADDVVLRWHGLYLQRPAEAGRFMLRLKLPGGAITAEQLRVVVRLARRIARPTVNLTTRQGIELHGLALADLPQDFAELETAGLTTLGACGDVVRNIVTCPVAGLAAEELIDTSALVAELTAAFLGNPAFGNLPRKLKIAVCGCGARCVPTELNDVGLVAAQNDQGQWGYALRLGGGLSVAPSFAVDTGIWLAPTEVTEVVTRIAELFREHSNRQNRGRARLKYLLAERGLEWFRGELEARLARQLTSLTQPPAPFNPDHQHLGLQPQKEPGRYYLGLPVPAGRLGVDQLETVAELAQSLGRGRLRLSYQQDLIIADLSEAARQALLTAEPPLAIQGWGARLVSCTGKEFCKKSLARTKEVALALAAALDEAAPGLGLTLHVSGCTSGCGLHQIADVGLQGTVSQTEGGAEERFDLWLGGGKAGTPEFARRVATKVRPNDLPSVVGAFLVQYQAEALPGEAFSSFAQRILWEK